MATSGPPSLQSDQRDAMLKAGADLVFDTFTEAGVGFASHVLGSLPEDDTRLG